VSLRSEFHVVMSVPNSAYKHCSLCLYLQLSVGGPMSYLRYLCLLAHSGEQHIILCLCFVCPRLVFPVLPFSLDCSFLIAPSVFSNVYLSPMYTISTSQIEQYLS
jgi:hypothetical protein